jgi:glucan endo-1,3-alpha-glucosidase
MQLRDFLRPVIVAVAVLLGCVDQLSATELGQSHPRRLAVASDPNSGSHYVFAHYMVAFATYGESVEGYRREIMEAQDANIDGFALNVGAWDSSQAYYQKRVELIYNAAEQLGTEFKLFFSVDFDQASNVVAMVEAYAPRPNSFRYQGKTVLSAYGQHGLDWGSVLGQLRQNGVDTFFVPHFFAYGSTSAVSNADDARSILTNYAGVVDGLFLFAPDSTIEELSVMTAQYSFALKEAQKLFMASVSPNYWGCIQYDAGRRYYESFGGEGVDLLWSQLIPNQPDWVEIVTWNDFNESTYISPVKDPGKYFSALASPKRNSHAGYLELAKYFITWYKSGQQPPVDRDLLLYYYRTHPKNAVASNTNDIPVTAFYGDVQDELFLTTLLRKSADLLVSSGGSITRQSMDAGLNHLRVPFQPGPQVFEMYRDGRKLARIHGPEIQSQITNYNFFPTSGYAYFIDR